MIDWAGGDSLHVNKSKNNWIFGLAVGLNELLSSIFLGFAMFLSKGLTCIFWLPLRFHGNGGADEVSLNFAVNIFTKMENSTSLCLEAKGKVRIAYFHLVLFGCLILFQEIFGCHLIFP